MILNILRTKTKQIKQMRDLQKSAMDAAPGDYMVGLYNGLEMAVAILEQREPDFLYCVREPTVIEAEEQTGRTVTSGIKRRSKTFVGS